MSASEATKSSPNELEEAKATAGRGPVVRGRIDYDEPNDELVFQTLKPPASKLAVQLKKTIKEQTGLTPRFPRRAVRTRA